MPTIALLLDRASGVARELAQGVMSYARTKPGLGWSVRLMPVTPEHLSALQARKPDGVIGQFATADLNARLRVLQVPAVNLSSRLAHLAFPSAIPDDHRVGVLAAEHFIKRGIRRLAYLGPGAEPHYSVLREEGFGQTARAAGLHCLTHNQSEMEMPQTQDAFIEKFLHQCKPPHGIFCGHDLLAMRLAEVCQRLGLKVPQDIAICGAGNDELICESAEPPLSSVSLSRVRVGHEGADMLAQLLKGKTVSTRRIAPDQVVCRQSTDVFPFDDSLVSDAMRLIHARHSGTATVKELLRELGVSRSWLDLRFREALGHTPFDEIQAARLQKARLLLAHSDLPVETISHACGYTALSRFSRAFRRETGQTPSAYRKQMQM